MELVIKVNVNEPTNNTGKDRILDMNIRYALDAGLAQLVIEQGEREYWDGGAQIIYKEDN